MRYIEIDARELLWSKEALEFYDYLADKVVDHPAGKKYLEKYFKNKILNNELVLPIATENEYKKAPVKSKNKYIKKALDNNELFSLKFDDHHKRLFTELFDYIRTLDKTKPINIPYKDIPKVVQKYHEQFTHLKEEKEDLDNIETIYTFKDGYKWVSINSKQGLKRESSLMQHCVGEDPQYWSKVEAGKILILSLRDKQNKPHITIEYNLVTHKIPQIQGKQDLPPIQKYIRPYLEFLLISHKSPLKHLEKFQDNKIYYGMQYQDKHFYSPFDLPDNFTWQGKLYLSNSQITKLPEGLHVGSSLYLCNTPITKLPEVLKVDGHLNLEGTQITEIPKDLHVGGNLNLSGTKIKELPKDLHVVGNLYLRETQITKLPEGLHVGGGLDLYNTPITELPEGLQVDDLDLSKTKITEIPKDLNVVGNLYLRETQITKLPEKLRVGGNLDLSDTPITELPKGLRVDGNLWLNNMNITKLPEGLYVGGVLDLRDTSITELPEGLHVGGYLDLRDTSITELPEGLHVGGYLDLRNTNITKLPKDLHVGDKIFTNSIG